MNFVKNCALSAGVLALAVGLSASQANAQSLRGTFNLPFQARWGTVVLDPGAYTLRLSTAGPMSPIFYITGQGKTVMVFAGIPGTTDSEGSYLSIENVGETHFVREFHAGVAGELFTFSVPKAARSEIASVRNAPDMTVQVASSGGN